MTYLNVKTGRIKPAGRNGGKLTPKMLTFLDAYFGEALGNVYKALELSTYNTTKPESKARIAVELMKHPAIIDENGIPKVTYCEPEVASVGLSEAKAKEIYGAENVSTYEYNLGGNGKSQILGTAGFIKLVRKNNGPVIGVHMIGSRVGEQIGEGQLIVNWEAYPDDVASLLHAHPTMNEAIGEAHLALAGKPLHAHA